MDNELKLMALIDEHGLFRALKSRARISSLSHEELGRNLANLHNRKRINIVSEFASLNINGSEHEFFDMRDAFEGALPLINDRVENVVVCVRNLIKAAGSDISAYWILNPFIKFCSADSSRPEAVIKGQLDNYEPNMGFLRAALLAGAEIDLPKYIGITLDITKNANLNLAREALGSIARMNFKGGHSSTTKIFNEIISICSERKDDELDAELLKALVVLNLVNENLSDKIVRHLDTSCKIYNEPLMNACAEILFQHKGALQPEVETSLLSVSKMIRAENEAAINYIDLYLADCLRKGKSDVVADFIESVFEKTKYAIKVSDFNSVQREFKNAPDKVLSTIITRWILLRKVLFGRACCDLIEGVSDLGVELGYDTELIFKEESSPHKYLATQACGWFFGRQITSVSLILSLVDHCSEEDLPIISDIIFNPLLVSYSGSVADYLDKKSKHGSKAAKKLCGELLNKLSLYQDGLRAAFEIKELHPSDENINLYRIHHQTQMDEAMKRSSNKFSLSDLFKKSVLLYGRSSIQYMEHGDKESRQEIPLSTISHTIEIPALLNIDPEGLEEKLFQFRQEGCYE